MSPVLRAGWARFAGRIPLALALTCIALVAAGGWVWSFEEQTRWATGLAFTIPWLLPIVLDGLALSLAGVAFAAALDGRPAVSARVGTAVAVMASATSNGAGAWHRSDGNRATIVVASAVPIAANLAFEVFLGELRRQVHRKRGMAAPVAVVGPRLIRLALAPIATSREWRRYVLAATDPTQATPPPAAPQLESTRLGSAPQDRSARTLTDATAEQGSTPRDPSAVATPRPGPAAVDPVPEDPAAGSAPPVDSRSDRPTRPTLTRPASDPTRSTQPTAVGRTATRLIPPDWTRVGGSTGARLEAVRSAITKGWITRPVTEADVRAVVEAGGVGAREMRDQINAESSMAGERHPEVARG